eukprot:3937219-Rhodomonas_salina.1
MDFMRSDLNLPKGKELDRTGFDACYLKVDNENKDLFDGGDGDAYEEVDELGLEGDDHTRTYSNNHAVSLGGCVECAFLTWSNGTPFNLPVNYQPVDGYHGDVVETTRFLETEMFWSQLHYEADWFMRKSQKKFAIIAQNTHPASDTHATWTGLRELKGAEERLQEAKQRLAAWRLRYPQALGADGKPPVGADGKPTPPKFPRMLGFLRANVRSAQSKLDSVLWVRNIANMEWCESQLYGDSRVLFQRMGAAIAKLKDAVTDLQIEHADMLQRLYTRIPGLQRALLIDRHIVEALESQRRTDAVIDLLEKSGNMDVVHAETRRFAERTGVIKLVIGSQLIADLDSLCTRCGRVAEILHYLANYERFARRMRLALAQGFGVNYRPTQAGANSLLRTLPNEARQTIIQLTW